MQLIFVMLKNSNVQLSHFASVTLKDPYGRLDA